MPGLPPSFVDALRPVLTALAQDTVVALGEEAPDDRGQAMYAVLGRVVLRPGRPHDALLSARRLGARLAWERFQAAGDPRRWR